jgi:hypothetical protein
MTDDRASADVTKESPKAKPTWTTGIGYKARPLPGQDAAENASVHAFRPLQSWPMARHKRQVELDAIRATPSWEAQKGAKSK